MLLSKLHNPILVLYRFILAFVVGYVCTNFLVFDLTLIFKHYLAQAEAVYLPAFIGLIFFIVYVIYSFIIPSLTKLSVLGFGLCSLLYIASLALG